MLRRSPRHGAGRAIAVTGIGAISAAGDDAECLWQAALAQQINATWLDASSPQPIACCRAVLPMDRSGICQSDDRRLGRFAQLGVVAGQQAWQNSGVGLADVDPRRLAVFSGTSRGPAAAHESKARRSNLQQTQRIRPTAAVYSSVSSLTGALAEVTGARGPTMTVSATCASSAVALGVAAMHIASGACDVALAGGADAPLQPDLVAEMQATGVLGTGARPSSICRPFDRDRTGIVIGEAAAYLVLEAEEHAMARGADVRAWLTGWSSTCDPGHRSGMSDDARGLRDALAGAIAQAGCTPDDVDALHLHGTATRMNDTAEADVVRQLFGSRGEVIPCTSTKPITGHCLGASGALQAVINVRALEEQHLPPTANCRSIDADCRIAVVQQTPWSGLLRTVLTHSAGFWGHHAGLLFRRA